MQVLQFFVIGLTLALCGLYARFWWGRRRLYKLANKIPGSNGLPFIGDGLMFLNSSYKKIVDIFELKSREYPGLKKFWLGPTLLVLADTPEIIKTVLNSNSCTDKSKDYSVLYDWSKAIPAVNGAVWKHHRKVLNPAFSANVIQTQVPTFDEKAKIMVRNLKHKVGELVDFHKYATACSLETVLKTSMDIDRDYQSDPFNIEYLHHAKMTMEIMMQKVIHIQYQIKPYYKFTQLYQLEKKHFIGQAYKLGEDIFNEKESLLEKSRNDSLEDDEKPKPKNFIKTLLNLRNGYDREEMKQELGVFMLTGYESSGLTISHVLLMLAMHPEVQDRVVKELKDVYGSPDAVVDYDSIERLYYLDMVVKETMRLFPTLAIASRCNSAEVEIDGYTVPKGTTIVVCVLHVHRSKLYWGNDADQFRPERFEPENIEKVPNYAFIPFTGGPRICIAKRYGVSFVKTCLANMLLNYKVSTPLKFDEIELEVTVSLKIVQKIMLKLQKRNIE